MLADGALRAATTTLDDVREVVCDVVVGPTWSLEAPERVSILPSRFSSTSAPGFDVSPVPAEFRSTSAPKF